jgi:hypothetical protein
MLRKNRWISDDLQYEQGSFQKNPAGVCINSNTFAQGIKNTMLCFQLRKHTVGSEGKYTSFVLK